MSNFETKSIYFFSSSTFWRSSSSILSIFLRLSTATETDEPIKQIYRPDTKNIPAKSAPKSAGLNRLAAYKFFKGLVIFIFFFFRWNYRLFFHYFPFVFRRQFFEIIFHDPVFQRMK